MTPEEQDVYALMGISPMVLTNREVKNSRSVIINVTLPGQLPAVGTLSNEPTVESLSVEDSMVSTVEPVSDLDTPAFGHPVEEDRLFASEEVEEVIHSTDEDSDANVLANAEAASDSAMADEGEETTSNGVTLNRRRRRRSSAIEGASSSPE